MDKIKAQLKRFQAIYPEVRGCSDMNVFAGVYPITTDNSHMFKVRCETGGWTVIQKRFNGVTEFYRDWQDYENGFGNLNEEFWLGNKYIALLTSQGNHQLKIDLDDWNGDKRYALFESFKVGDQSTNYTLTTRGYSGNAGDSLSYHNNMPFSTYDRDNDDRSGYNCAADSGLKGAWWFNNCWSSSLNGKYSNNYFAGGIKYSSWRPSQNLKESSMMIRRT